VRRIYRDNEVYQDTLSASFTDRFPEAASDGFDVLLANPPFTGSLDFEDVHPGLLRKVKTRKTELLFLVLMLRMLKTGGRCAVIVPDGVLFGSSKAHAALRHALVEETREDRLGTGYRVEVKRFKELDTEEMLYLALMQGIDAMFPLVTVLRGSIRGR